MNPSCCFVCSQLKTELAYVSVQWRRLQEAFSRLHQVKANFTPVSISAMEDFISRGDRRVAAAVRRAWELGATNDGWWQNTEGNHKIWSQAIDDCGLVWKYRQVDDGEWNVMDKLGDVRYRKQGGSGKGRIDRGELADRRLDAPLPWDHIDTGISKWWLKADLQRALEAATVPDCSHSSICSECGVCGEEFGENVTFSPPPVPEFVGHGRPNSTRAQRFWIRFGKTGDMVFVGHLDLMALWDRACRRAALPITSDESPFSARTRIYAALPLPLGATSTSEILEINLTELRDGDEVARALQTQLPDGITLRSIQEVEVKKIDGRNGEKMGELMRSVEYYIAVAAASTDGSEVPSHAHDADYSQFANKLERAAEMMLDLEEILVERPAKAKKQRFGRSKRERRSNNGKQPLSKDVRPSLLDLRVFGDDGARMPQDVAQHFPESRNHTVVVRFRTRCSNGNPELSPATLVELLGRYSGHVLERKHVHRSDIEMAPPAPPQPDWNRLRSLARMEGHLAAEAIFRRTGAWAKGLEHRTASPV